MVPGREILVYSRDAGGGFRQDMGLQSVLEGRYTVFHRKREETRGVCVCVCTHTRKQAGNKAREKEREEVFIGFSSLLGTLPTVILLE